MSSKKPDNDTDWSGDAESAYQSVAVALNRYRDAAVPSLVVAYSGGVDSHLLLTLAGRWAMESGARLRAVYIDHGLQPQSHAWGKHCERECERLSIAFECLTVSVNLGAGESPEKAARDARYTAFEQHLQSGEWLLTAHHADDQTETLMLQLLRGAGVQGLAAMPVRRHFGAGVQLRPMLALSRHELVTAAAALRLQWVEDPSNTDLRFDRNYLRHRVLPALRQRWPAADKACARSASHAAQAARLLSELAALDIPVATDVLSVPSLQALTDDRRNNALRAWISQHGYTSPSTTKLEHLVRDLVMAPADSRGCLRFGRAEIRRHRQSLYIGDAGSFSDSAPFDHWWENRSEALYIPETGHILVNADLPLAWIPDQVPLRITSRQGGEKIKLNHASQQQSVKSLLQQQGLPPWQRCRLPFVWRDDELLGVVGLGFVAPPYP